MQRYARFYSFTIISLLVFILSFFTGCGTLTARKKESVPKNISYTLPKWKHVGNVSNTTPTVTRVLKNYTGNMPSAINIIKSNHYKYNKHYYKTLPYGASIYISEDQELYINPDGGKAPDTVIIKRKPNPEYYMKKKTYRDSHSKDDGSTNVIYEEDLKK